MTLQKHFSSDASYYNTLIWMLLILTFSCQNDRFGRQEDNNIFQRDSVDIWIDRAQTQALAIKERHYFLEKAHTALQNKKKDTASVRQLARIQWTYNDLKDSLRFRQTNRETTALAQSLDDSVRVGISYWDLGEFFNGININDSAFFYLTQAQKIFKSIGHERKAGSTLYDIARLQSSVRDYTGAENSAIEAVELIQPLDDNLMLY
ncbi:MAG: hypothetical protein KJN76_02710, partial [Eudoraea sp.]|nr:hypothetical protein [Eudoraea sp.]